MGLKKGMTNNPNGRPKGAINKSTVELRQRITDFLNENWETVQKDWKSLDTKDRLRFYEKMLQYKLPLLQRTELTSTEMPKIKGITFNKE